MLHPQIPASYFLSWDSRLLIVLWWKSQEEKETATPLTTGSVRTARSVTTSRPTEKSFCSQHLKLSRLSVWSQQKRHWEKPTRWSLHITHASHQWWFGCESLTGSLHKALFQKHYILLLIQRYELRGTLSGSDWKGGWLWWGYRVSNRWRLDRNNE